MKSIHDRGGSNSLRSMSLHPGLVLRYRLCEIDERELSIDALHFPLATHGYMLDDFINLFFEAEN